MSHVKKTTRSTTTTTYSLTLPTATLDDLRRFVEDTVHLGAGAPIQVDLFGITLAVHETQLNEEEAK